MKHLKIEQSTTSAESVTKEQLSRLNEVVKGSTLDASSNLKGELTAPTAYIQDVDELMERFSDLVITVTGTKYVRFDDAEVKRLLLTKAWDTDGDGDFTVEELAAVTGTYAFGSLFKNNATMEYFNELKYFTGLTTLPIESSSGVFYNCTSLKSIRIPSSIKTINSTFNQCSSLVDVGDISHLTQVDGTAFRNCSSLAIDVNLPNLTSLGAGAFQASGIKRVLSLGQIVSISGTSATSAPFLNCTSLTEINLPSTMPEICQYFCSGATSLKKLTGTQYVTTLNSSAFNNCPLESVSFPNVTSIGYGVFADAGDGEGTLTFSSIQSFTSYRPFFRTKFKKLVLGGTYETLPSSASSSNYFAGVSSVLEEVVLSNSLKVIQDYSFTECTALRTINLHSGITSIGTRAFNQNTNLEIELNLPNLETLGMSAFRTSGITSVKNLGKITQMTGTQSNSNGTFYGCKKLKSVVLPSSLKTIGQMEFMDSSALESVDLGGVESMSSQCFNLCSSLTKVKADNLKTMTSGSFRSCSKLVAVNLPAIETMSGTSSGSNGNFQGTQGLRFIYFGPNLTNMGASELIGSTNLIAVFASTTPPTCTGNIFANAGYDKVFVPDASVNAYKSAQYWSNFASSIRPMSELWGLEIPEEAVEFTANDASQTVRQGKLAGFSGTYNTSTHKFTRS